MALLAIILIRIEFYGLTCYNFDALSTGSSFGVQNLLCSVETDSFGRQVSVCTGHI